MLGPNKLEQLRQQYKREHAFYKNSQIGVLAFATLAGAGIGSFVGYGIGLFVGTILFSDYSSMSGFIGAGVGIVGGAIATPLAIHRLSRLY